LQLRIAGDRAGGGTDQKRRRGYHDRRGRNRCR
jgi:hypothetical protein